MAELSSVMNTIGSLVRMASPALTAYNTARTVIDVIAAIHTGVTLVTSGQFNTAFLASAAALPHFNVNDAIESILLNYQAVLSRAFPVWSAWLLSGKALRVEGFVIYLPSPPTGAIYAAIPAGKFRGYKLTLIAGGAKHTSRVFGVGLDMRGAGVQYQQIWRMDYHLVHLVPGTRRYDLGKESLSVFEDGHFHHHVLRPQ